MEESLSNCSLVTEAGSDYEELLPQPERDGSYASEREGSSLYRVAFNFVNVVVGAGIVGLPYVFKEAGFCMAIGLMTLLCWLTDYSVRMLVSTGYSVGVHNYEDLMHKAFGKPGYLTVCSLILVFDFGAILSYLIILGDSSSLVVKDALGYTEECASVTCEQIERICISVASVVLILPLCLSRDISNLESASFVSIFTVVVIILMVMANLFTKLSGDGEQLPEITVTGPGVFQACGIISFSFVCHDSAFLLYQTLGSKARYDSAFLLYQTLGSKASRRWTTVTHISLSAALGICLCFSISGYLTFGRATQPNVLNNYDSNPIIVAMRVLYCITMALTYPTGFFVCRHIINALLYNGQPSIQDMSQRRYLMLTAPLFLTSVGIALIGLELDFVMALSGAGAGALAFILPPLCRLRLCQVTKQEQIAAIMMASFGTVMMLACILQAFEKQYGFSFGFAGF
ncbi:hypothetical protein CYMTET_53991 [Cymbomonas tetramitiformis]|uniref:Amino acid transporter transmembrane domain-containing protein n=1 Tax=Cymbomonas tetramitiformis TaxID=36881 RepID=A0AAE0BG53_9CHLO|nr:hypothetical protein CYMTET_53991 [Cymbomonas tetramitiformis]